MILDQLKKTSNFSESEKNIINLIFNKGIDIEGMTIRQLAKESYTNPSSFIRLSHKLGFKGWKEFKHQYLKELRYQLNQANINVNLPFDAIDSFESIAIKITETKISAMQDTLNLLDNQKLRKFMVAIYSARKIVIFAHSVNLLLAQEFKFKMKRIKKEAQISDLSGEQIYDVLNMDPDDCALIISYSGDGFQRITDQLKKRDITINAITGLNTNPLALVADNILNITTRENLYTQVGNYSTDTAISQVLDIIYSLTLAQNFSKNYHHIIHNGEIANVRNLKSYNK